MVGGPGAACRRRVALLVGLIIVWSLSSDGYGASAAERAAVPNASHCAYDRLLRLFDPPLEGHDVWELQNRLAQLGYYDGPIDSRFHARLEAAVRRFQDDRNLTPDGVVGLKTWEALAVEEGVSYREAAAMPPPPGKVSIVVDTERLTLTVYSDGEPYKTYPVAVGRPRQSTLTPVGEWRIVHKALNWGGGFGTRWLGLNVPWGIYGIHGTNKPYSIGTRASAGCIRMFNRDVEELYEWVSIGTPVTIIGVQPVVRITAPVVPGRSGREIVELQKRLREAGFDPGPADSRYGPATERAVRNLQAVYGLEQTGRADLDVLFVLGFL